MNSRALLLAIFVVVLAAGCGGTTSTKQANNQVLVKSAAAGAEETTDETMEKTMDPDDPDALRCKRIKKVGTRISERICATNHAWEKSEKAGQKATEDFQRRTQYGRDGG